MHQITCIDGLWIPNPNRGNDLGLWRGDSVVEVLEARGNILFHWEDHYRRMLVACTGHISLDKLPREEDILQKLKFLLTRGGHSYSIVHMQVTPGNSADLKIPDGKPMLTLDVGLHQIQDVAPLSLKTIPERRIFPLLKLGSSYGNIPRFMRHYKVKEDGFDSFLYWSGRQGILEAPYENIFYVTKDRWLFTAEAGVLHGITRKIILALAEKSKLFRGISKTKVHVPMLETCNEAFLTSTTKGTAPIKRIDEYVNFKTGDKTYTAKLRKLFLKYRENYYKERGAA